MDLKTKNPILLAYADDHLLLRDALSEKLEQSGKIKVIITAEHGEDLIRRVKSSDALPDICLLDIKMPVMNGFETAAALKKQWSSIKIIALSGYETDFYKMKMIENGADAYLNKRTKNSELIRTILALHQEDTFRTNAFNDAAHLRRKAERAPGFNGIEEQLLKHCAEEKTLGEIAHIIGLTPKSIEMYRYKLYQKIGVRNRVGLLLFAIRHGYVTIRL